MCHGCMAINFNTDIIIIIITIIVCDSLPTPCQHIRWKGGKGERVGKEGGRGEREGRGRKGEGGGGVEDKVGGKKFQRSSPFLFKRQSMRS